MQMTRAKPRSGEPHRIDWGQGVRDAGPVVALILAHPKSASRGAEGEPVAGRIKRQRMAIDDVIGVPLRQATGEDLERLAAVARAG